MVGTQHISRQPLMYLPKSKPKRSSEGGLSHGYVMVWVMVGLTVFAGVSALGAGENVGAVILFLLALGIVYDGVPRKRR